MGNNGKKNRLLLVIRRPAFTEADCKPAPYEPPAWVCVSLNRALQEPYKSLTRALQEPYKSLKRALKEP
jgi:hypothetical protein